MNVIVKIGDFCLMAPKGADPKDVYDMFTNMTQVKENYSTDPTPFKIKDQKLVSVILVDDEQIAGVEFDEISE